MVIGHHVVAEDVNDHLEGDDDHGKQEVEQEVFLLDAPLRADGGLVVKLPDEQRDEGLREASVPGRTD